MTHALAFAALCLVLVVGGCDRDREKTPDELLAEDTTLAVDLARVNDAMGAGEPDTTIGLTDDSPLPAPPISPPHIESGVADPGVQRPAGEPRVEESPAEPPVVRPPVSPPPRVLAASAPGCDSPTIENQRRCLLSLLAQYDVELNSAYREVIQRLRRDAGVGPGEPDPAAVRELRAQQRSWLVYRDRECRRRTRSREGQLWAPVRARCLGQLSDERARELRSM